MHRFRRRLAILLIAPLASLGLASAALVTFASPASASITCYTTGRHYVMYDGPNPAKLGWFELHIEVCTNGNEITSSMAWDDRGVNGTGTILGYRTGIGPAYRTAFDSGGFSGGYTQYRANGWVKVCYGIGFLSICSGTEDFKLVGKVTMLNQLIIKPTGDQFVLHGRVFDPYYTWACTNSLCNNNLHLK